jgi:hypothetical protein
MPFKSKAQARLMYAVEKNPKLSKQLGIPMSTAKKMVKEGQSSLKKLPNKVKKKK